MKKILIAFSIAFAAVALATSCKEDNPVKTITVTATVDASAIDASIELPDSYEVTFTNTATSVAVSATTENNIATVSGILPGIYNVSVSASTASSAKVYTLSGSASNCSLTEDNQNVVLTLAATAESALIFKEIYYAGAPGDSYYFRDQFYEIYNNSSETVYADGLCIAETAFANYDFSVIYEYGIENPEKYVFVQDVFQVPGEGHTYPVAPGESFVIAQWATNHKAENLSNGTSPVDLSGAEFEAFVGESTTWNGITLTDEAAINLNHVVNAKGYDMPQWLTPTGGSRYILFYPSSPLRTSDFIVPTNTSATSTAGTAEVLITDVLDGVEVIGDETRLSTLGLPNAIDAGYIIGPESYTGKSISRKVASTTEDGRKIYVDTNNTTNDFEINDSAELRRNGAGVPSWNTWIK